VTTPRDLSHLPTMGRQSQEELCLFRLSLRMSAEGDDTNVGDGLRRPGGSTLVGDGLRLLMLQLLRSIDAPSLFCEPTKELAFPSLTH
jgi:hypothetical protein